MQLKQIDEETGEIFVLDRTDALSKDLQDYWAADCKHEQTKIVTKIVAGGGKQIRHQCLIVDNTRAIRSSRLGLISFHRQQMNR